MNPNVLGHSFTNQEIAMFKTSAHTLQVHSVFLLIKNTLWTTGRIIKETFRKY